jgi:molybdopterin synthase sulfur carrier subunit
MQRVLFFGRLRDIAGVAQIEVSLPPHIRDVADVRAWLGERDGALGVALGEPGVRVAVDRTFAGDDASVNEAREVAFMSPLSGG